LINLEGVGHDCNPSVAALRLYSHDRNDHSHRAGIDHPHRRNTHEDEDFWEQVHKHEVTFGEGDLLRVRLTWKIQEKHHELKQKNIIVKVLEKLERPKQMRLDGKKDDEILLRDFRKFRRKEE
jgi:hypothetical protein